MIVPMIVALTGAAGVALTEEQVATQLSELRRLAVEAQSANARLQEKVAQLQDQVGALNAENARLKVDRTAPTAAGAPRHLLEVEAMTMGGQRRRLGESATCCRWTPDGMCPSTSEGCTRFMEYLEHKTTTHSFESAEQCLGNDPSTWKASFNGANSNVTLSSDGDTASVVPTPLKVTHSANCSSEAPILTLQMDTVVLGGLTVGGFDVAAALTELGATSLIPPPVTEYKVEITACADPSNPYLNIADLTIKDADGVVHTYESSAGCTSTNYYTDPDKLYDCTMALDGPTAMYDDGSRTTLFVTDSLNNVQPPFFLQWTASGAKAPATIEVTMGTHICSSSWTLYSRATPGEGAWTCVTTLTGVTTSQTSVTTTSHAINCS